MGRETTKERADLKKDEAGNVHGAVHMSAAIEALYKKKEDSINDEKKNDVEEEMADDAKRELLADDVVVEVSESGGRSSIEERSTSSVTKEEGSNEAKVEIVEDNEASQFLPLLPSYVFDLFLPSSSDALVLLSSRPFSQSHQAPQFEICDCEEVIKNVLEGHGIRNAQWLPDETGKVPKHGRLGS